MWRGSVTDLLCLLVSLIKAKSIHLAAGSGRLPGKETLRELFAWVRREGELSRSSGSPVGNVISRAVDRASGGEEVSGGEEDPSISSGSSKKHLQAEAKISPSTMGCFMCLPRSSGAVRRACLEAMSWASEWGYLSSCEGRQKGCLLLMERKRHLLLGSNKESLWLLQWKKKPRASQM